MMAYLKEKHHQRTWDVPTPHSHAEHAEQHERAQCPHIETAALPFGLRCCWFGWFGSCWFGCCLVWVRCIRHISKASKCMKATVPSHGVLPLCVHTVQRCRRKLLSAAEHCVQSVLSPIGTALDGLTYDRHMIDRMWMVCTRRRGENMRR